MNIVIDGQKIDFSIEREKTVGEILGIMESECEKSGMTVTAIRADGREIPPEELDDLFALAPDKVGTVELSTISAKNVRTMLSELGGRFSLCIPDLVEIPVLLQTGKDIRVMEIINGFSSDLYNLYQILPLLSVTGIDAKELEIDGTPLASYPTLLSPVLRDLLEALEKKDTILVGDLSEYELAPKIERLGAVLAAVS